MSKRKEYSFAKGDRTWATRSQLLGQGDAGDPNAEFPKGHFETPPSEESLSVSRRGFMSFATAALALVGAEGCRRPVEKIVPYSKMPEDVIPGQATHYATVMSRRGEAL